MSARSRFARRTVPIPDHWVGVKKGWPDLCQSIGEALVTLTPSMLSTHAYVPGTTGVGKSCFMTHLKASDLRRGISIVDLDGRGDSKNSSLELVARAGVPPEFVKIFDLREKDQPLGFNPLAWKGEPYFPVLGLIDAVAAEHEGLGVQTTEYMRNCLLVLAEAGAPITELEAFFHNPATRRRLLARVSAPALIEFWQRYDRLSPEKQSVLASPVLNKFGPLLATEGLRRMFGHPCPVDLGEHLRTPGSVTLISLAVDELHSAGWMVGQIMLSSICREVFSQANLPESQRNPLRLYVDEFENFNPQHFESILAEGRRFKFSVVLAHQTLAQLTPKIRSMILGNCGVKVVFRTSHQDAEILNSDLTGVKGAFDLASLPVGEAVLWRRGEYPFQIEVNAPLIEDVGDLSPLAREYLKQLAELAPAYYEVVDDLPSPDFESSGGSPEPPASRRQTKKGAQSSGNLEDWLQ